MMNSPMTETPDHKALRDRCSAELQACIERMVKELGAPLPMVVDRLVVSGAGLMTAAFGRKEAIGAMLAVANRIDAGDLDLTPSVGLN